MQFGRGQGRIDNQQEFVDVSEEVAISKQDHFANVSMSEAPNKIFNILDNNAFECTFPPVQFVRGWRKSEDFPSVNFRSLTQFAY